VWQGFAVVYLAAGLPAAPADDADDLGREDDAAALAEAIDRVIDARLDAEGLRRVQPADDAELVRRLFLDLHGVVPPADRVARFLDDSEPGKRARLIDELIDSSRFGEHLADIWQRRLLSPPARERRPEAKAFAGWLADRFNADRWDRIVRDLLTASGKPAENPAVAYLIEERNPLGVTDLTDLASRYFLGVRLGCAQCHDHPFVDWKQEDYWGMAAFFAQIQTPGRPKMVHSAGVRDDPRLTLASLRDAGLIDGFQPRPPAFLGGQALKADSGETHRAALARWVTSPVNPYFARAAVNRTWWQFFGRGIVDPVDDMHAGNPPSHPELLDLLSRRFVASGFDYKVLCRAILNSRTYQQTSRPGEQAEEEARLFARMTVKTLSAEQLHDSLIAILGPPGKDRGIDARARTREEFCRFFGSEDDPDPTRYERGIPHVLRLMNSPQFAGRNLDALVSRIAPPGRAPDEVAGDLYLTILARRPTPEERHICRDHLRAASESAGNAWKELAWALLMSSEFALNH
jgi:hypothetical protein